MKKLVALIIMVLCLSMSISAFAEIGYQITPTTLHPTERLKLRAKPTTNSSQMAIMDPVEPEWQNLVGTEIIQDDSGNLWVRIDTPKGTGYGSYWSLRQADGSQAEPYHTVKKKIKKLQDRQLNLEKAQELRNEATRLKEEAQALRDEASRRKADAKAAEAESKRQAAELEAEAKSLEKSAKKLKGEEKKALKQQAKDLKSEAKRIKSKASKQRKAEDKEVDKLKKKAKKLEEKAKKKVKEAKKLEKK